MILNPIMPVIVLIILCIVLVVLVLGLKTRALKILGICAVGLLLIIGLRPMVPNGELITYKSNIEVIFVMDSTLSMLAEDYGGGSRRIDVMIDDVENIVGELPGAYYSLISFGNSSVINLRSTIDANAAVTAARTVRQTDPFYARGSNITVFKEDLEKILKSLAKKNERKRVVFLLTDGEDTAGKELESLADLKQYVDDGAVLGYGTVAGGKMKVDEFGTGEYTYLKDKTGGYPWPDALSKIDENNLKKMASGLGVDYIHVEKQSDVMNKIKSISNLQELDDGESEHAYDDVYYIFAWFLLGVLLAMLVLMKREYLG